MKIKRRKEIVTTDLRTSKDRAIFRNVYVVHSVHIPTSISRAVRFHIPPYGSGRLIFKITESPAEDNPGAKNDFHRNPSTWEEIHHPSFPLKIPKPKFR